MKFAADITYAGSTLRGAAPSGGALLVLDALEADGLEAWLVGGWVRDALMGIASHDIDICCSGSWEQNADTLHSHGIDVIESGTKFGGITAVVDGERIEVTAYRLDGFYSDGRHPEQVVQASCVEEDLARRDFTVNAMAWHPRRGLLDCYDGCGDIERRVIRAVGDPRHRFEEDALRMLRAVRFACRLDFVIEEQTARALAECAPLLDQVARERVGTELNGILLTRRGGDALLRYPELMCAAVPELAASRGFDQRTKYHAFDVYDHVARVLTVAGELSGFCIDGGNPAVPVSASLMWAALLHDIAKPDMFTVDENGCGHFYGHPGRGAKVAHDIMRRLSCSNELIRDACLLIRYHDMPLRPERESLLRMMQRMAGEGVDTSRLMDELFDLKRADTLGKAPSCFYYVEDIERMRAMTHELIVQGEAYSIKTLDLTGGDLIAAGMTPGRQIGEALKQALEGTLRGEVPNRRADLLVYVGLGAPEMGDE